MNTKIWLLLCATSVLCVGVLSAGQKPKFIQPAPSRKTTTTPKDDLYIDDDTEGSGGSNLDGKDDLESAGSGFGPDDEDAERDSVTFSVPKNRNANSRNKSGGKGSSLLPLPTTKAQPMPPLLPTPPPTTTEVFDKDYTLKKGANDEFTTTVNILEKNPVEEGTRNGSGGVFIINHNEKERTSSFFAQPGILAAVIGGAVVGLLCAILVVMFIVYRMKKKDEGSYVLEEMKRSPPTNPYMKTNHREFFA